LAVYIHLNAAEKMHQSNYKHPEIFLNFLNIQLYVSC